MEYQLHSLVKSLSLDELYGLLCNTVRDMCNASDGKNHQLFLGMKDRLDMIRDVIKEKKEFEKNKLFYSRQQVYKHGLSLIKY